MWWLTNIFTKYFKIIKLSTNQKPRSPPPDHEQPIRALYFINQRYSLHLRGPVSRTVSAIVNTGVLLLSNQQVPKNIKWTCIFGDECRGRGTNYAVDYKQSPLEHWDQYCQVRSCNIQSLVNEKQCGIHVHQVNKFSQGASWQLSILLYIL